MTSTEMMDRQNSDGSSRFIKQSHAHLPQDATAKATLRVGRFAGRNSSFIQEFTARAEFRDLLNTRERILEGAVVGDVEVTRPLPIPQASRGVTEFADPGGPKTIADSGGPITAAEAPGPKQNVEVFSLMQSDVQLACYHVVQGYCQGPY